MSGSSGFPDTVIGLLDVFNTFVPDFCQECIFRTEGTDIPGLSDPSSPVIEDEKPPAVGVAADPRACQVYRARGINTDRRVTENRAGIGISTKNTRIQKTVPLGGINADGRFLAGIIVEDQKQKSRHHP